MNSIFEEYIFDIIYLFFVHSLSGANYPVLIQYFSRLLITQNNNK